MTSLFLLIAGALTGCASGIPPGGVEVTEVVSPTPTGPAQRIEIIRTLQTCDARVGDQVVRVWAKEGFNGIDLEALAKLAPNKRIPVEIVAPIETPYRCIGGLVFNLQRLGHRRVNFISEPPPAPISTPDK